MFPARSYVGMIRLAPKISHGSAQPRAELGQQDPVVRGVLGRLPAALYSGFLNLTSMNVDSLKDGSGGGSEGRPGLHSRSSTLRISPTYQTRAQEGPGAASRSPYPCRANRPVAAPLRAPGAPPPPPQGGPRSSTRDPAVAYRGAYLSRSNPGPTVSAPPPTRRTSSGGWRPCSTRGGGAPPPTSAWGSERSLRRTGSGIVNTAPSGPSRSPGIRLRAVHTPRRGGSRWAGHWTTPPPELHHAAPWPAEPASAIRESSLRR